MRKFAPLVLATLTLAGPALSVAGNEPTNSAPRPSSFVPHTHSNHHVYGAPIEPPIVGRAKSTHHKRAKKSH